MSEAQRQLFDGNAPESLPECSDAEVDNMLVDGIGALSDESNAESIVAGTEDSLSDAGLAAAASDTEVVALAEELDMRVVQQLPKNIFHMTKEEMLTALAERNIVSEKRSQSSMRKALVQWRRQQRDQTNASVAPEATAAGKRKRKNDMKKKKRKKLKTRAK